MYIAVYSCGCQIHVLVLQNFMVWFFQCRSQPIREAHVLDGDDRSVFLHFVVERDEPGHGAALFGRAWPAHRPLLSFAFRSGHDGRQGPQCGHWPPALRFVRGLRPHFSKGWLYTNGRENILDFQHSLCVEGDQTGSIAASVRPGDGRPHSRTQWTLCCWCLQRGTEVQK